MTQYQFPSTSTIIPGTEDWKVDSVRDLGLFHYDQDKKTLGCAFIWLCMMGKNSPNKLVSLLLHSNFQAINFHLGDHTSFYYLPTWQQWEHFNAAFRCLKAEVYNSQFVKLSILHSGAMLSTDFTDVSIFSSSLSLVQASHQYLTKSGSEDNIIINHQGGSCKASEQASTLS